MDGNLKTFHYKEGERDITLFMCVRLLKDLFLNLSDHKGRTCIVSYAGVGQLSSLKYNRFRWQSIIMIVQIYLTALFLFCY